MAYGLDTRRFHLALSFALACALSFSTPARAAVSSSSDLWLARARHGLATGHPQQAIAFAQKGLHAAGHSAGQLHLVLGLAELQSGQLARALDAFVAAERALSPGARPPATYNRAVALLRLGRPDDAEPLLAALATSNGSLAGDAALGAALAATRRSAFSRAVGYLDRAATLDANHRLSATIASLRLSVEQRARVTAAADLAQDRLEPARDGYRLAVDLAKARHAPAAELAELESTLGYLEFGLDDLDGAKKRFEAVRTLRPDDADATFMLARVAQEDGDEDAAARGFALALERGLDAETRQNARTRLDALSFGLRAAGGGFSAHVEAFGGYDTNATQSAVFTDLSGADARRSGFAALSLGLDYGHALSSSLLAQVGYAFGQVAYARPDLAGLDLQAHSLGATGEATLGAFRLLVPVTVSALYTGLLAPAAFQQSLTARPMLAFDETVATSSSLEFEWTGKRAGAPAYVGYAGQRLEAALTQVYRPNPHAPHAFDLRLFARHEELGLDYLTDASDLGCARGCFRVPVGYRGAGAAIDGRFRPFDFLGFAWSATGEWRTYDGAAALGHVAGNNFVATDAAGDVRVDRRGELSASVDVTLARHLALVVRYDFVVNRSNLAFGNPGHELDYDDKNFTKQVIGLGVIGFY